MRVLRKVHLPLALLAVIAIYASIKAEPQDLGSLDRRISMLEQRFYTLESSMNRLQQVVVSQRSAQAPNDRDQDVQLMRQEIEGLKLRLNEIECGLVRVDERTTPEASRKRSTDPCRIKPDTSVRLSTRP